MHHANDYQVSDYTNNAFSLTKLAGTADQISMYQCTLLYYLLFNKSF